MDDDGAVHDALHVLLDDAYRVLDAADGRAAVAMVRARRVDLVLLDILLPDLDGLEVLKELKALAAALPVIMLTGVKTVQTTVAAMKLGAADYVTKPFDGEELLATIHEALGARGVPAPGGARRPKAAHAPEGPRILLWDRDPVRRAAAAVLLQRFGRVEATDDRRELDAVLATPTLCVLLGVERLEAAVLRIVRAVGARWPRCPIVAALARDDRNLVRELEALGVQRALRPPVGLGDVLDGVHAVLAGREEPGRGGARLSRRVGQAIDYVRTHYKEHVNVDGIAEAVGVSGSHLAHVFREETGMTVKGFVARVRVEVAKFLLATTEDSLSEIAAQAGFWDAAHLARAVREHAGASPRSFRRPAR